MKPTALQVMGQSYKDFYTLGQIYIPVRKHENMR